MENQAKHRKCREIYITALLVLPLLQILFFSHPILEKNQHFFAYAWINKRFSTKLCQTHTKKVEEKRRVIKKQSLESYQEFTTCALAIEGYTVTQLLAPPQNKGLFANMSVTWLCSKSKVFPFHWNIIVAHQAPLPLCI